MDNARRCHGILAILFDLDNTLIPTRKGDQVTCNKLTEHLWKQHGISLEKSASICGTFLKTFRKSPDNPSMNLDMWRHLLWTQALGQEYKHLADELYKKWLVLRYQHLALTPEIISLLSKLRQHYFLGLITNGPSCAQQEKIHRLHLKTLFDIVLVSGDLPWEKPDHEIFHQACGYLGVEPKQCLMVGDNLETDIMGGINADLGGTVWVPTYTPDVDENDPCPDYVIENITDLPTILPRNPKVLRFRNKNVATKPFTRNSARFSLPDLEDYNSNSSDGS